MQQRRRSSHLCPSGLTWLCTPLLLLAALLAIPAGEPVNFRIGQQVASSRLGTPRFAPSQIVNILTIQKIDISSGIGSEAFPGSFASGDSPWAAFNRPFSRQTAARCSPAPEAIPHVEALPPSPHSAAHPAVFFALSPPIQRQIAVCFL